MPGLIGYMVAIVVTLGGYLVGLHWLVSPPDPWQSGVKITQIGQPATKKRPSVAMAVPADVAATPAVAASTDSDIKAVGSVTSAETVTAIHLNEPKPIRPIKT